MIVLCLQTKFALKLEQRGVFYIGIYGFAMKTESLKLTYIFDNFIDGEYSNLFYLNELNNFNSNIWLG